MNFIVDELESLKETRYKVIVQTTIGQLKDQGVRVASRCLWDPNFDNYASTSFINVSRPPNYYPDLYNISRTVQQTLYCSVLIFCLYTD
jgi:uncharacterized UPF0146 family protein